MAQLSVSARTALVAMLVMALTLAAATVALITTLRSSLLDEVDRSIDSRAADVASQVQSNSDVLALGVGIDARTLAAVVAIDEFIFATTDDGLDAGDLVDAFDTFDEPFDISLPLTETEGADNMRAVSLFVDSEPFDDGLSGDMVVVGEEDYLVFVATSLDGVDNTVRRVTTGALIAGPALVGLVGMLTLLLTRRALRPVEAMRQEVDEISSTGLDRRVPQPPADDEIGRLATTMNEMLARLERAQHQQQQFVADASHELRSPLASMAARLDVAHRHGDAHQWLTTVDELRGDTDRMRRLIEDLLLLARADATSAAGQAAPGARRDTVHLDDTILDTVAEIGASRPGVSVDVSAVGPVVVGGDSDQLQRLTRNLVENAIRHATTVVHVAARQHGGGVEVHVDDDGAGIARSDRVNVFERFVRLDEARARDGGGSGLGLAICAEIVRSHNGTITVSSAPTGGARFTITLPTPSA